MLRNDPPSHRLALHGDRLDRAGRVSGAVGLEDRVMDQLLYGSLIGATVISLAIGQFFNASKAACERQHNAPCEWVLKPKEE